MKTLLLVGILILFKPEHLVSGQPPSRFSSGGNDGFTTLNPFGLITNGFNAFADTARSMVGHVVTHANKINKMGLQFLSDNDPSALVKSLPRYVQFPTSTALSLVAPSFEENRGNKRVRPPSSEESDFEPEQIKMPSNNNDKRKGPRTTRAIELSSGSDLRSFNDLSSGRNLRSDSDLRSGINILRGSDDLRQSSEHFMHYGRMPSSKATNVAQFANAVGEFMNPNANGKEFIGKHISNVKNQLDVGNDEISLAKSSEFLGNVHIGGQSMDQFFSSTISAEEKQLQDAIELAYKNGAIKRDIGSIVTNIKKSLSVKYCQTQYALGAVLNAIKKEKYNSPYAVKEFKTILSGIYEASAKGKQRLDYFLQIWISLIRRVLTATNNNKKMLDIAGREFAQQIARMLFRDIQNLGDAVYEAAIRIEEISRSQMKPKKLCNTSRCP